MNTNALQCVAVRAAGCAALSFEVPLLFIFRPIICGAKNDGMNLKNHCAVTLTSQILVCNIVGKKELVSRPTGSLAAPMGWLRLVGCLRIYVSLQNIGLFCRSLLQKRPIFLSILLIVATPYLSIQGTKQREISEPSYNCSSLSIFPLKSLCRVSLLSLSPKSPSRVSQVSL